ncbi:MAG: phosphomannomutase [Gammaproteobacteria bacterium]
MLDCFKAYDVRGRVPDDLNEDLAYRIGRAYVDYIAPRRVVVGRDIRETSPALTRALASGLLDGGANVFDIGLCGTEEVYFATFHARMDGGIMITASHNPPDYNGMKFVREAAKPISGDSGLKEIAALAEENSFAPPGRRGEMELLNTAADYVDHLLSYADAKVLRPLKIVVNAGNGGAGKVVDLLEKRLPFEFVKVHHEPDNSFPHGVPNPLLPENRPPTIEAIRESGAELGVAWDGDYDRCFLFDETGAFVEGYYIVGLLASTLLEGAPGARIVHDPRLTWNTIDMVKTAGGVPVQSKTGHAFIKERMRSEDAIYGGEMSAHHYFRKFAYCDSGMIPWLLITRIMSETGKPLSALVAERIARFPASGEINRKLADPPAALEAVRAKYSDDVLKTDFTDGLSMEFESWRFNLRASNTEPVVRLNVESRGDVALMQKKTQEILSLLDAM